MFLFLWANFPENQRKNWSLFLIVAFGHICIFPRGSSTAKSLGHYFWSLISGTFKKLSLFLIVA